MLVMWIGIIPSHPDSFVKGVILARKRKADHETAVAAALDLFWDRGYQGASTRQIEEKTGLTRFTLQTAYGGKEGFFLDTLDQYLDNAEAHYFPHPDTCALPDLADWFEYLTADGRMPQIGQTGCLAFNSISQFDRDDSEVNKRIERYLNLFRDRALSILERAIAENRVQTAMSPQQMADVLVDLLLGLHVIIKARSDDSLPQAHAKSVATLIRSWAV